MWRSPDAAAPRAVPVLAGLILAGLASAAFAGPFDLGREATPEEIAAWDHDARPDGHGLPEGAGSAAQGAVAFASACAACHGARGEGSDRAPALVGGAAEGPEGASGQPGRSIGASWPFAVTLFDHVNRATPCGAPQPQPADVVFALTAHLLALAAVVESDFVLDRDSLVALRMPAESRFTPDDRIEAEHAPRSICMQNCVDQMEIDGLKFSHETTESATEDPEE